MEKSEKKRYLYKNEKTDRRQLNIGYGKSNRLLIEDVRYKGEVKIWFKDP